MYPVNQVILGGDSMMTSIEDLDTQIQKMEAYRRRLQEMKGVQQQQQQPVKLIWDEVDAELLPMSNDQKDRLFDDEEYVQTYTRIQSLVQAEILNLVKGRIEGTPEGKELLQNQLKIVRRLKSKIIDDTNREMEIFKRFKEYSKAHPGVTYEEFIKASM